MESGSRISRPKVLYVAHNHPTIIPGGVENYALELYEGVKAAGRYEPILLARSGPPVSRTGSPHPGTALARVNDDEGQLFFYTDSSGFDLFRMTAPDKRLYTSSFRDVLLSYRPDVVHFQHTLFFGVDILRETRNTLPDAAIVYTLHEYLPICHRDGQMLRTVDERPCSEASPRRCHECFPEISPQAFFARKRFIQSHFELVDLFLSPSRFLIDRYVDWGIPREKMRFEPNGRIPPSSEGIGAAASGASSHSTGPVGSERPRNRFAFFGQFSRFKGVQVLLDAMRILADEAAEDGPEDRPRAWLHGANLELRSPEFRRDFEERLEATRGNVTLVGRYERDDLPELMKAVDWVVIPSIWWENSPLVIQEAFMHGRPVICSDIGGMAEKVEDGVSGLHFRTGDARSLADTMRAAARDPDLWSRLQRGIPEVYWMDEAVESISAMYDELLEQKKSEAAA
jgi:glycosyltransferase involved in cell wall biosynthesis